MPPAACPAGVHAHFLARWVPGASRVFVFLVLLAAAAAARAEVWELANGDRLTGELIEDDGDTIEIKHAELGLLRISRKALKEAETPVQTEAGTYVAPAVAPASFRPGRWKHQVEFGFSQQSGTKSKRDLNVRTQLEKKWGPDTYRATARVLQSDVEGTKATDRREADFRWRHDFSKRLFTQLESAYVSDDIRAIGLSLEQQVGGGYRIIDEKQHKVNVGLGVVAQHLQRDSFPDRTLLLGSAFQDYSLTLSHRLRLVQEASVQVTEGKADRPVGSDPNATAVVDGNYRFKVNAALEGKVTNQLSLNLRFEYDYDRAVPEVELRGDQRLITSLGYAW